MNMTGKICMITGANSGIGKLTTLGLAETGARVVMVCRDAVKGEAALSEIVSKTGNENVELMVADLGSQQSIRDLVGHFRTKHDQLHLLINNAAIIPVKRQVTEDGYEAQFGVNHLGPFLLTNLLLDVLKASAPSRIVNVASTVHYNASMNFDDLQSEESYGVMKAYGQSKLANILFTYELARKLEGTGVTVNCLHPGVVRTRIMRDVPFFLKPIVAVAGLAMLSPEKGAKTSIYVATSPDVEGVTGKYFDKCAERSSSSESRDEEKAKRLWDLSAEMTGVGA